MYFVNLFRIILFLIVFSAFSIAAVEEADLPVPVDSLQTFTVDAVEIEIGDAFDDSKAHTFLDSALYGILNVIHVETHEAVVHKLLLFEPGDTVSLYQLIESERYLRDQRYISDASITREVRDGKNVMKVKTSDNWTLSIPLALEHPGDEWYYGIGIQENNFLGFGQTVGVYYSHDEFRDMFQGMYENSNFFARHNHFKGLYSYNTDGYTAFGQMNLPYLTRTKNQWAYTIEGLSSESDVTYYASGKLPYGSAQINAADYIDVDPACDLKAGGCAKDEMAAKDTLLERAGKLNDGKKALKVMTVKRMREDSLSLRLGHSFGNSLYKFYLTASYDYHDYGNDYSKVNRYFIKDDEEVYAVQKEALPVWIPSFTDSRFGIAAEISRIRYDRILNYQNVKWIEDVDRGYSVKAKISKNSEQLGASDNDWRLDYRIKLALGGNVNHLSLGVNSFFYFDEEARRDIYEKVSMQYIFKPTNFYSTVFEGQMDAYKRAALGKQLTLGGIAGMNGLPTAIFAGQARFYANLEQRFFPPIEIGTVVPVFTAFVSAGETTTALHEFEPRDLQYLAGIGVRFGMTKSIVRAVNHINLSWPVHGPLEKNTTPRISIIGKYNL